MTAARPSGADPSPDPASPSPAVPWPELDDTRLGCVACDAAGRPVRWNPAAERLLGRELLARPVSAWTTIATIRGDDGRPLPATALPFGPGGLVAAADGGPVERTLVLERPGERPVPMSAVVERWPAGDHGGDAAAGGVPRAEPAEAPSPSGDAPGPPTATGTLTWLRSAERDRRIADAGRERTLDLERRLRRQVALVRATRAAAAPDGSARPVTLLERLTADLPADVAAVVITRDAAGGASDGADSDARSTVVASASGEAARRAVLARHAGGVGDWIVEHRRPLTIGEPGLDPFAGPDAASDAAAGAPATSWPAWAAVPLTIGDEPPMGVLYSLHRAPRTFDADDLAYLEAVAAQAAGVIARGRLIARLRGQAAELAAHRDRLEELVRERTIALEATHARLRVADRLAAIGTFTAGLGHDMENVLFPLRCRLDALELGATPPDGPVAETLEATRHALGFLRDLSDGLRLFARDPLDGPAGAATPLAAWWTRVEPLLRHATPDDVRLEADVDPALPPVAVPAAGLTQAVLNLVVNAADAIDGAGTVRVEAAMAPDAPEPPAAGSAAAGGARADAPDAPDAAGAGGGASAEDAVNAVDAADAASAADRDPDAPSAARDGTPVPAVLLRVRDEGRGMDPQVASQAFDPFFSTRTRTVSTGLGLWLVHQVVERAGGRIEVDTAPRRGTCITLRLPVAASAAAPAAAGLEAGGAAGARGTSGAGDAAPAAPAAAGPRPLEAVVRVRDPRRAAWISAALADAGFRVRPEAEAPTESGPVDLLAVDAEAGDEAAARTTASAGAAPGDGPPPPRRTLRLGGKPNANAGPADATVHEVPDPDDLPAVRRAIMEAVAALGRPRPESER